MRIPKPAGMNEHSKKTALEAAVSNSFTLPGYTPSTTCARPRSSLEGMVNKNKNSYYLQNTVSGPPYPPFLTPSARR